VADLASKQSTQRAIFFIFQQPKHPGLFVAPWCLCFNCVVCGPQRTCTGELPPNVKKKKSASFKYKLTKVPQPIKLVVRITLLVTFLKQLSEFYFLSN
jgi:hypothetical protein